MFKCLKVVENMLYERCNVKKMTYADQNVASQKAVPGILWVVAVASIKEYRLLITSNRDLA